MRKRTPSLSTMSATAGMPLVMLHGWPEFWYGYLTNTLALVERFDVLVSGEPFYPGPSYDISIAVGDSLRSVKTGWADSWSARTWFRWLCRRIPRR